MGRVTDDQHGKGDKGEKGEKREKGGEEDDSELDEGRTSPFGWVSLVVIVVLVVGTWFLVQRLMADSTMQDCVQSGRRNCAPIENTGQ